MVWSITLPSRAGHTPNLTSGEWSRRLVTRYINLQPDQLKLTPAGAYKKLSYSNFGSSSSIDTEASCLLGGNCLAMVEPEKETKI
jgi:hypothetical protein